MHGIRRTHFGDMDIHNVGHRPLQWRFPELHTERPLNFSFNLCERPDKAAQMSEQSAGPPNQANALHIWNTSVESRILIGVSIDESGD